MIKKRHFTHIAWSFDYDYDTYVKHHQRTGSEDALVSKERYEELCDKYSKSHLPRF